MVAKCTNTLISLFLFDRISLSLRHSVGSGCTIATGMLWARVEVVTETAGADTYVVSTRKHYPVAGVTVTAYTQVSLWLNMS